MSELQKNEKIQDVSKKLSGFLEGVVEKAKNLDVNELTEKAKQKLNDVKDKANELNLGKTTENIQPREDLSDDLTFSLKEKILSKNIVLPKQVNLLFSDFEKIENVIFSIKLETSDEFILLTKKQIFHFFKSSDQYGISIYNIKQINNFTIVPPRNEIAGKFILAFMNNELRFSITNLADYFSLLLLYENLNKEIP